MIIMLLRFLRGYIEFCICGVSSEQILSRLNREKVLTWKLRYSGGNIYGNMFANDFKKIRKARKGTGVKIKITAKHGFPFFAAGYKRRVGFFAGAIIFFVLLRVFSCYVWVINVEGNSKTSTADILKTLGSIGIYEGMKSTDIDPKGDAQVFLLKRDDLAWASLNIEGSVLTVNVSEITNRIDSEVSEPTNLIAAEDGIIKKIDAVSGDVRVKVGDCVHKGDLLVSGIIENLSGTVFVESNAAVTAQTEKTYTDTVQLRIKKNVATGEYKEHRIIEILGLRVPMYLPKRESESFKEYGVKKTTLLGKRIPINVYCETLRFYKRETRILTREQAIEHLESGFNDFLTNEKIDNYIPVSTEYITDDADVTILHRYLCYENIAKKSKIITAQ